MARAKQRSEQHLIDQQGEKLLRSKLPKHWVIREYRPDYGLDFAIEVFKSAENLPVVIETLGEHFFIQLKSITAPNVHQLKIFSRENVEKGPEILNFSDQVANIEIYKFQLETSELVTVERMGIAIPVLLVIADLATQRCSFVCLNDYIDKILIPRHEDYRIKKSRAIHVPIYNEIGTDYGLGALRWYAKRPKLLAAFQRFAYQYSELKWAENEDWRGLAEIFAGRLANYDFWDDIEMCNPIKSDSTRLQHFIKTGQPGFFKEPTIREGFDILETSEYYRKLDVFELWRQLSILPTVYEDIWREWFLPTSLGCISSVPNKFRDRQA